MENSRGTKYEGIGLCTSESITGRRRVCVPKKGGDKEGEEKGIPICALPPERTKKKNSRMRFFQRFTPFCECNLQWREKSPIASDLCFEMVFVHQKT